MTYDISCLDMEEVHQISYLTMHGWELLYGDWRHVGFSRMVSKNQPCGCCEKEEKVSTFSLEEAYLAQKEDE